MEENSTSSLLTLDEFSTSDIHKDAVSLPKAVDATVTVILDDPTKTISSSEISEILDAEQVALDEPSSVTDHMTWREVGANSKDVEERARLEAVLDRKDQEGKEGTSLITSNPFSNTKYLLSRFLIPASDLDVPKQGAGSRPNAYTTRSLPQRQPLFSLIHEATANNSLIQYPAVGPVFSTLPHELFLNVIERCLEEYSTSAFDFNARLTRLREVSRSWCRVIEGAKHLWFWATSQTSLHFLHRNLALSHPLLLSVEYIPKRVDLEELVSSHQHLKHFLETVCPPIPRWKTADLRIPPLSYGILQDHLSQEAPRLQALSIAMEGGLPLNTLLLGMSPWTTLTSSNISLFSNQARRLRTITLRGIPGLWSSIPFTDLAELTIIEQTQLTVDGLLSCLHLSPNLEKLHLADIEFLNAVPPSHSIPINLPKLKLLCLVERAQPAALSNLFLAINSPVCASLELDLDQDFHGFTTNHQTSNLAAEKMASVIQNTVGLGLATLGINPGILLWSARGEGCGFNIVLKGTTLTHLAETCSFVRNTLLISGSLRVALDVGSCLSGADSNTNFFIIQDVPLPALEPQLFFNINPVELKADVVDGALSAFANFVAPPGPWLWPNLTTIHLRSKETFLVDENAQQLELEAFVAQVSKSYYAWLPSSEAADANRKQLKLILYGRFHISMEARAALLRDPHEIAGISLDFTQGQLVLQGEDNNY